MRGKRCRYCGALVNWSAGDRSFLAAQSARGKNVENYPKCPKCQAGLVEIEVYNEKGNAVDIKLLWCSACEVAMLPGAPGVPAAPRKTQASSSEVRDIALIAIGDLIDFVERRLKDLGDELARVRAELTETNLDS